MWHPLGYLSPHASAWLLGALMLFTILLGILSEHLGQPLKTKEAPHGIVSFELAFNAAQSERIVRSWRELRENAKDTLHLDYVFIPFYSTTLVFLCLLAGRFFERHAWTDLSTVSAVLAWYQWVAGLLDMVENWALLRILNSSPPFSETLPWLAAWCAVFKFVLILLALVCFLVAVGCSLLV